MHDCSYENVITLHCVNDAIRKLFHQASAKPPTDLAPLKWLVRQTRNSVFNRGKERLSETCPAFLVIYCCLKQFRALSGIVNQRHPRSRRISGKNFSLGIPSVLPA